MALEIERKFLIEPLSHDVLVGMGARVKKIEQAFLIVNSDYPVRRIRKTEENGVARYFYTLKKPAIGEFSREEIEQEIAENLYLELQNERDFALNTIVKTRYVIASKELNLEIDKFKFFNDFDILEIELPFEGYLYTIPINIKVIKEVTTDFRFTNFSLAREIPSDIN